MKKDYYYVNINGVRTLMEITEYNKYLSNNPTKITQIHTFNDNKKMTRGDIDDWLSEQYGY